MIDAVLVFLAYVALDFVFAKYVSATAEARGGAASSWSTGIVAFSGYITISYVSNPWLLIPAGLGAFVGTYLGVVLKTKGKV